MYYDLVYSHDSVVASMEGNDGLELSTGNVRVNTVPLLTLLFTSMIPS